MIGIDDAINSVATLANTVVSRIWPDASETERLKVERIASEMSHEFQLTLKQLEINKTEAYNPSVLISGWRPFIGWICGLSFAYVAILEPFARFIATVAFNYGGEFPDIDTNLTLQVLGGILGLAGMRTYEKRKGIARR